MVINWISENYVEVFGAVTGIIYVFLEVRQNSWLWPVGIVTSAVYIWIFFTGKLYADMSLQGYYLVISVLGWWWWVRGSGHRAQGTGHRAQGTSGRRIEKGRGGEGVSLEVSRLKLKTAIILALIFILLLASMIVILNRYTDSPVPGWDSFITSLSIVATWMLARKIYDHWYLWIIVNIVASVLFFSRGLYPTMVLYIIYAAMSFTGLIMWKRDLTKTNNENARVQYPGA